MDAKASPIIGDWDDALTAYLVDIMVEQGRSGQGNASVERNLRSFAKTCGTQIPPESMASWPTTYK